MTMLIKSPVEAYITRIPVSKMKIGFNELTNEECEDTPSSHLICVSVKALIFIVHYPVIPKRITLYKIM